MRFRPAEEGDGPAIGALVRQAFPRGGARPPLKEDAPVDVTDRYVIVAADVLLGTAAATPVGQYVGGVALPTAAVWSVAVSDTARGRGVGGTLMSELLRWLRDEGMVQSALYPSVPAPYRAVGYEIAGERRLLKAPLHSLPSCSDALPLRDWDDADLDSVIACYDGFAASQSGLLKRPVTWWTARVLKAEGASVYRRAVEEDGRLTGYLIYSMQGASADLSYYYNITVHDVAWLTPKAARSLLGYLASHRALGVDVRWPAAAADAWTTMFGGHLPRVDFAYNWMLRLVDPVGALQARGYSTAVEATVSIRVTDPVLSPADQVLELEVSEGSAKVRRVEGKDAPRLDVGALAALYSGWATAGDLLRQGRLTGARSADLTSLNAIFHGPRPWLSDMF